MVMFYVGFSVITNWFTNIFCIFLHMVATLDCWETHLLFLWPKVTIVGKWAFHVPKCVSGTNFLGVSEMCGETPNDQNPNFMGENPLPAF